MRPFLLILCLLPLIARAEEPVFSHAIKASLIFRDNYNVNRDYQHILDVDLRLESLDHSAVYWVTSTADVEAELLDASGKAPKTGPMAMSVLSSLQPYRFAYGSKLDWPISSGGGISFVNYTKDDYVLIIGSQGWLIPISQVESYSLRIRVKGYPWTTDDSYEKRAPSQSLFEVPPTKIKLTTSPRLLPSHLERRAERP